MVVEGSSVESGGDSDLFERWEWSLWVVSWTV